MKRALVIAFLVLAGTRAASAQPTITGNGFPPILMSGEGWEAFPNVEYQGGDASVPKKRRGILVLTDSTLSFYRCVVDGCPLHKTKTVIDGPAILSVKLAGMKEIAASTEFKGTSTGSKILWGAFAGDKSVELVGMVYETDKSAEAPVFATQKAQASAIEAKVKFRLKKLGIELPAKP